MKRPFRALCLLACWGLTGAAASAALAPAINWISTLFTRDNFPSMTLRGARASFPSHTEIEVVDLDLTVYAGDATRKVETVIRAPAATFLPRQDLARGESGVQVTRDDLEASGTHWTYDRAEKKVSLTGRVRIVFNAEIKGLLK